MVDLAVWDSGAPRTEQPSFALQKIIDGEHDEYIRRWAGEGAISATRFSCVLTGKYEMERFPGSEAVNGNRSGQYVQAWRHVHDIFRGWEPTTCMGLVSQRGLPQGAPACAVVSGRRVRGLDVHGWVEPGRRPAPDGSVAALSEIFAETYTQLLEIGPSKPISDLAIWLHDIGGSKAEWIMRGSPASWPAHSPRWRRFCGLTGTLVMGWVLNLSPGGAG